MENNSKQPRLLDEFSAPTYEEWLKLVESQLKGAPFEKKLVGKTLDGISIQPMYRRTDIDEENVAQFLPGAFPFVRGTKASGPVERGWGIFQRCKYPDAARLNEAVRKDISRGLNTVSITLDQAGKAGLDPDQAASGETGKDGVSLFCLSDVAQALEGVDPSRVSFYIDAGNEALSFLSLTAAFMKSGQVPLKELKGKVVFDPLAVLAATGELNHPLDFWYDGMASVCEWASQAAPELRVIGIDVRPYCEGGAGAVQELAVAMATGAEYMREMLKRGLDVSKVASSICFFWSTASDFFMEIAKFRAARGLWARVAAAFGGDEEAQKINFHVSSARRNKSLFDPHVNMIRTTTEAFSGVLAGCDSMDVLPFDDAQGLPDENSSRIAANTQLVIKEECRGDRVIDPAGGSWFVESLTEQLGKQAWALFQEIEGVGGVAEALRQGMIQEKIEKTRTERSDQIYKRKKVVLGTNMFPNLNEEVANRIPDYDMISQERGKEALKRRRNDEGLAEKLKSVSGEELMNAMIEAAVQGNTLGELASALKSGKEEKHAVTPLVIRREAEDYEELRKAAARFEAETGSPPKVFLAGMGPLRQHKARSDFSLGFMQPGGFSVIYNQGFEKTEEAVEAAIASGASIVVICSTDAAYPEIVPELAGLLKSKNPKITIALAGYPKDHIESFKAAGVDEFIHLKAENFKLLKKFQEKAGVK